MLKKKVTTPKNRQLSIDDAGDSGTTANRLEFQSFRLLKRYSATPQRLFRQM